MGSDGGALPEGFRARPPRIGDAAAIARVVNACTMSDVGMASYTRERVEAMLDRSSEQIAGRYLVVEVNDEVVGWVEVDPDDDYFEGFVEPSHEGRGVGTFLVRAAEELLLRAGRARAVLNVGSERARALAGSLGYSFTHGEHAMVYDLATPPPPVAVPEGVEIAPFRHGVDEEALFEAMRSGFGEDWPRETQMDTWLATHQGVDHYDPELWLLARDGDSVVGALQARPRWGAQDDHGWVKNLAVMPEARHRGVGRALLFEAFRRFYDRGKRWVVLGVDADNPTKAPEFYLRIGMQVRGHSWDYERRLDR